MKSEHDKSKKEDFTVTFIRKITTPLTNLIYPLRFITPNRVTWIGFSITIIGAALLVFAEDNIFLLFLVGLCYWISAIFDVLDGQLARKRGQTSRRGQFLDVVLEEGKGISFFIAVGLRIQDSNGDFTLRFGSTSLITLPVWPIMSVMFAFVLWFSLMSFARYTLLDEPRIASFGHLYIVWVFLVLNLLDWFLVLFTIASVVGVIYTLFEKTFLYSETKDEKR